MSLAVPMDFVISPLVRVRRATGAVPVTVYATWGNLSAHRICHALRRAGVGHRFVDIRAKADPHAAECRALREQIRLPVVCIDGDWLVAPTRNELDRVLSRHGYPVVSAPAASE